MNRFVNLSREVVAKRIAVVSGVTSVLTLLVGLGVITPEISAQTVGIVGAGLTLLAGVVGTKVVRAQVTPSKDPRDDNGAPLIPVEVHEAEVTAARNDAHAAATAADIPEADDSDISWPDGEHTPEHAAQD